MNWRAKPAHWLTPSSPPAAGPRLGADYTLEAIEREHLLRVVARTATLDDAARILGIDASTLYRKRKQYEEEKG